mgnify:CR=1 FL=1|jgi:hypothetical protein
MDKKFIKTTDEKTAGQLIVAGFELVSIVGSIYTFFNQIPKNFNFDIIDKKKIVYDNKLTL